MRGGTIAPICRRRPVCDIDGIGAVGANGYGTRYLGRYTNVCGRTQFAPTGVHGVRAVIEAAGRVCVRAGG